MNLRKKIRQGIVVSDKMDKTGVILVQRTLRHPLYKKIIRQNKRYKYHDEHNQTKIGDIIKIIESRPISKDKRWRLLEVIEKAI